MDGFETVDKSLVCKLNKALYGLKETPRQWFDKLKSTLSCLGFQSTKFDPLNTVAKLSVLVGGPCPLLDFF